VHDGARLEEESRNMTLSNIALVLASWFTVSIAAGILIGTMMARDEDCYPEAAQNDRSIRHAA
jgi:hypothetical protein